MNPNKALWEKGDFTQIAASMRESGEGFVKTLGVGPGMRVLDLGCGDGTTALPLDDTFDLTMSVFGAMFAPKPFDVAKEMVRVTRPGGRVVMGNWIPGHPTFVAQVLKISSAYTPPPPEGFVSPMTWGVEQHIVERFGQAGVAKEKISLTEDTFVFRAPEKSPAEVIDAFRRYYGPTMNAYEAAEKNGKVEDLHRELVELANAKNMSEGGGTRIPATFLRVTVSV